SGIDAAGPGKVVAIGTIGEDDAVGGAVAQNRDHVGGIVAQPRVDLQVEDVRAVERVDLDPVGTSAGQQQDGLDVGTGQRARAGRVGNLEAAAGLRDLQRVRAGGRGHLQGVGAAAAVHVRQRHAGELPEDEVVAAVAVQLVDAAAAVELVVTVAAVELIVAAAAEQLVLAGAAIDGGAAGAVVDQEVVAVVAV